MTDPDRLAPLRGLIEDLRLRKWIAPMSADAMNYRDRWLADQLAGVLVSLQLEIEDEEKTFTRNGKAEPPPATPSTALQD
jgi:hypothetical protein